MYGVLCTGVPVLLVVALVAVAVARDRKFEQRNIIYLFYVQNDKNKIDRRQRQEQQQQQRRHHTDIHVVHSGKKRKKI